MVGQGILAVRFFSSLIALFLPSKFTSNVIFEYVELSVRNITSLPSHFLFFCIK